jgi:hypothetical protein
MAVAKKKKLDVFDLEAKLKRRVELERQIDSLMREHGITDMQAELEQVKNETVDYAVKNSLQRIDLDGCHFTLISQHYGSQFIGTKDDLADVDEKYVGDRQLIPLRTIIFKKFRDKTKAREVWSRVTKRVPAPELIDVAVAEGLLTVDEIAPSFVEKKKSPYLRKFED